MHRYQSFGARVLRRRELLRAVVGGASAAAAAAVLAACGGEAAPTTAAATAAPTARPSVAPSVAPVTGGATSAANTVAPAAASTAAPAAASGGATMAATAPQPTMAAAAPRPTSVQAVGGTSSTPQAMVEGRIPAPLPGVPDAYTKYPAPFKSVNEVPGRGGKVTAFIAAQVAPPPPRDRNRYWQELEKRLGITWEPTFVPVGNYEEKFAALIAGGDLPDFVSLTNSQPDRVRAIQQGGFADLTPYLTGEAIKEWPNLAAIPAPVWKNLSIRGKIYGVPKTRYTAGDPLIVRGDWMEKLGNPKPKNADEFLELMTNFTKTDFDGKGKPFALSSDVRTQNRFSVNFFQQMFRVPNQWRVNPDGSMTYFLETEEFRQTLDYMRRLYTAQVFHPDAAMANSRQLKDGQVAGRYAAFGDTITGMPGQQRDLNKVMQGAKINALVPPGWDGGKPVIYNSVGYADYMGIPARVGRDRERVRELLRLLNYWAAPFGSEEAVFLGNGIVGVHHEVRDGAPVVNELGNSEKGDLSYMVNGPFSFYHSDLPGFAQLQQQIAVDLATNGADNPVLTVFSATNASKGSELTQLQTDRVIAIVTGREPLTALDSWIRDWRSRGGDTIRKEFQDGLKA